MKKSLLFITVIVIASCGQSVNKKQSSAQVDSLSKEVIIETKNTNVLDFDLIEFKGNKYTVGYPSTWSLNHGEMNNPSTISQISAFCKTAEKRAVTFQVMNLVDSASLEKGVKNLIAKYSTNALHTEFKRITINNNIFINTRIKFAINAYSESYFLKDGDNLIWLNFMGNGRDLDNHNHEFVAIMESFSLNKNRDK